MYMRVVRGTFFAEFLENLELAQEQVWRRFRLVGTFVFFFFLL